LRLQFEFGLVAFGWKKSHYENNGGFGFRHAEWIPIIDESALYNSINQAMLTAEKRRQDFPSLESMTYLNTAAESIPPVSVSEALQEYARDKANGMGGAMLICATRKMDGYEGDLLCSGFSVMVTQESKKVKTDSCLTPGSAQHELH
jgi:hypothetical protein